MQLRAATRAWMFLFLCFVLVSARSGQTALVSSITVTPSDNQAGESTLYDVTFTPDFAVLNNDTLEFTFPVGFDVSNVVVASPVSGMNGGLTVTIRGQNVLLARDGTGTSSLAGLPITVRFGLVTNTVTAGTSYTLLLTIRDASGNNRESNTSSSFEIAPGALDHFAVTAAGGGAIADQVAGTAFSIGVEAKDVNNNTVTNFTGTVSISDATGTITPATSGSFSAGVLASQDVTISKAQSNVTITVTGSGKSGTSNSFTVNPGALASFSIATISSPQTAGTPFSITITAKDASGNTVTSFNGKADLSISGGNLSPDSTANFSNGVVVQSVTATKAQSDAVISVTSGSSTGQSNAFNINPGALSQFAISTIASPQTAGTPFEITITAQDANQNTVTGFTGTVSIMPSAGTLTPSSSGSFIAGVRTEQITVPTTQSNLTITVSGSGAQGTSNAFNVNPGPLAKFAVTATDGGAISTQTAGTPFNIKIVAQDANDNTVTGFTGTVTISDLTGTITPTTSTSFAAGVLASQQVSINQSRSTDVITVSSGGATGSSNSFAVNQGALHHVLIRTAPNGGGVELGTYSMTADDSLTVYAAGYDIGNAFISDVVVNWSLSGGLAGNPASGTGSSFVFRPTTASPTGTVGQILANHATAIDDATGDITVTPGVPANALTLTANPNNLPADGASQSTITSSTVMDADGNAVGQGREFTVTAIPSTAGSIPTSQDTNPGLPGVQVKTNASSQLSFIFQAGTAGGNAQVFANSVNGASSGQTTVTVGSLDLVSISAPTQVSRAQPQAQVSMAVANRSGNPIVITSVGLNFTGTGGANRNADYPVVTRADTFTVIPPYLTRTLLFLVTVGSSATIDTVTISGVVNGTINGVSVSDNVAETLAGWRVKLSAGVLVDVVTAPAAVTQGQTGISVSVTVQNRLGFNDVADLLVDNVSLLFKKGATDVTSQYIVTPSGANPDTIPGGTSKTFTFTVDVGATATQGQITVDAQASGRDINSKTSVSDVGASTTAQWQVSAGASLQIISITTPPSVTAGLQGPWQAQMVLQNNSNSQIDIDIDSADTYIRFFKGVANVTSEYTIQKADTLLNSGTTILQPLSTDVLVFTITKTGTTLGDINISGSVVGTDIGPNLPISDTTDDFGQGLVKVQTPAALDITGITLSQNTVTQNQAADWTATVNVQNTGGAAVLVDFNSAATRLFLKNATGYSIIQPGQFLSGSDTLHGNSSGQIVFTVDATGSALGLNTIDARVVGVEINRNVSIRDSTRAQDGNQATFTVQTPAQFFIDSTYIFAPNAPFVNRGDSFVVNVRFRNLGQEQVNSLKVGLATSGNSVIGAPAQITLDSLGGTTTAIASFPVVADVVESSETFTASFISGVSKNTGSAVTAGPAVDDTAVVHIQRPAALRILDVVPSSAAVSANQSNPPWFIYVAVEDTGGAPMVFDAPQTDDISFEVNNVPAQPGDFIVQPPSVLKRSGSLKLSGGQRDTLVYTVTRTGPNGGTARITAQISARDGNNNKPLQQSGTGSVEITTSATVGITGTTALVNNFNNQGVGLVNTHQQYSIQVRIQNTGVEPVRDISVTLTTSGASTIASNRKVIDLINIGDQEVLTFGVTAPGSPNISGELFTARIDSAFSVNSGKKANILAPADPTERVITQLPAQLSLFAATIPADGALSFNQEFQVTARVQNVAGAAAVDNSGELTLTQIPDGYVRKNPSAEPLTRTFQVDSTVSWTFLAPGTQRPPADFVITVSRAPIDLNANMAAAVAKRSDSARVETLPITLSVTDFVVTSPDGARDRVVSTQQIFTVTATVTHSSNLTDVQATIILPPGYALRFAGTETKSVQGGTVSWEVQAPNSQTGTDDLLSVRAFGRTANQTTVQDTRSLTVTTVSQAIVQFSAQITSPPGASSGSLARGQEFTLTASLVNLGSANAVGEGEVVLDVGETLVTSDSALVRKIRVGVPVVWKLRAPEVSVPVKPLTVRLTKTPADENTGNDAAIFDGIRTKEINVQTRQLGQLMPGNLIITSPPGAQDSILSTDQEFTVQASVSWQNAAEIQAQIQFPNNSGYTVDAVSLLSNNSSSTGNDVFQWKVTTPSEPRGADNLWVLFTARDASDTTRLSASTPLLLIKVVQKPRLFLSAEISDPPSARDKKVSPDQRFTVRATISNLGEADTVGSGRIQISLPLDYTTTDTLIKPTQNGFAEWEVLSPPAPHEDIRNIDIIVIDTPRDENTGKKLVLDITKESIGITTETSKLEMRQLEVQRSSAVITGQPDVEMFRFKALNSGQVGASNILLNGMAIEFIDRNGNPIEATKVISGIKVRSANGGNELFRATSGFETSRLEMIFTTPDTLVPQQPDSVVVLVDVANTEAAKSFRMRLKSTADINAIDQESRKFVLVQLLNMLDQTVSELQSHPAVLIPPEFQESFRNGPNPFNPAKGETTVFQYVLPQNSDVELHIYTMFGELVYMQAFPATSPQGTARGFPNEIRWDGRNGNGNLVLNGVYLAVLKTNAGLATTKVAVLK